MHVLSFSVWALHFLTFSAKCMSLHKRAFSPRDQHILSFSHWVQHFLTLFSKVPSLSKEQNSVISPNQHVLSFSHCAHHLFSDWAHHFFALFTKLHEFVQNSVFSPRSARFVIFALGETRFSFFQQVHEFVLVQNSVFSPRSACFVIFALGPPLFSDFQQSTSVCPKHRFQP